MEASRCNVCPLLILQMPSLLYTYNGTLLRLLKEGNTAPCYNPDEPWGRDAEGTNEPVTHSPDSICMELCCLGEKITDRKQMVVVTGGGGGVLVSGYSGSTSLTRWKQLRRRRVVTAAQHYVYFIQGNVYLKWLRWYILNYEYFPHKIIGEKRQISYLSCF